MSSYTTGPGDTFEAIARRLYGLPAEAGRIREANPGVTEPLQPGTALTIPRQPDAPTDRRNASPAANRDEVAVTVDGERFRFWTSVNITRSMDAPDTVGFTAPFEPDDAAFRETFRPFSYKPLSVQVGGETLFTGTLVGVDPGLEGGRFAVSVSGYSAPGVLQDCQPPASAWPVEYDGFDLREIARAITKPFGVGVDFRGSPGAAFERAACNPGTTVLAFLTPLAQERNFVIGTTPGGDLLFWQSVQPGAPVARLRQGQSPLLSAVPDFRPQDYFSHVAGMEMTGIGQPGETYTERNPFLSGVLRPTVFQVTDAVSADVKEATRAKTGRMFGNMASFEVTVSTWRDVTGNLWAPNTTVTLFAPNAMVYRESEMIIRSVSFERDETRKTATLTLVLPGAFSGEIPEALPWDG